ncbi:uncharacterized protein LOC131939582 [Physella acuta]|uniref:uncharacterized protein LOC131939582 n=1 Tax=Physella acuta TaxID=109671 RepID=UPI0027DC9273|nr:uncharacterized protein LOC131939582 [Physella acuta]
MAVFARMGFKDTVNISMACIKFWDLVRVLTGAVHRLYGPISCFSPAMGKSWQNITISTVVKVQLVAGSVSYMMGTYVSIERSLCVSIPFTVRSVLTPSRTLMICILLSTVVFGSLIPVILLYEYSWVFSHEFNATIAVYGYSQIYYKYLGPLYMEVNSSMGFLFPVVSLTVMILSTFIISYHLRKSSEKRQGFLSAKHVVKVDPRHAGMSRRERKVMKMLLVVILMYITNLLPRVIHYLAMLCEKEIYTFRYYNNIFWVSLLLDFINSSFHLFIFYFMSSKFKSTLLNMLPNRDSETLKETKNNEQGSKACLKGC